MTPRFLEACEDLQAAQKACWDIVLRELPGAEAVPPAALESAMENTLRDLWEVLRQPTAEGKLARAQSASAPLPGRQPCAMRAHLPFFEAGIKALELITDELARTHRELDPAAVAADREELASAFDLLVQCQLESICAGCAKAGSCHQSDRRVVAQSPVTRGRLRAGAARGGRRLPARRAR